MTGFNPGIAASSLAIELERIGIIPVAVKLWTRKTRFNDEEGELTGRDLIGKADVVVLGHAPVSGLIHVAKQIVKLVPKRIPLLQCDTCMRYGHRTCQRKQKCGACAEVGHEIGSNECTKISSCVNCGKSHPAQDRECVYRKRELGVLKLMQDQGLSRSVAIQKTFDKQRSVPKFNEFPEMANNGRMERQQIAEKNLTSGAGKPSYAEATRNDTVINPNKTKQRESTITLKETLEVMRKEMEETIKNNFKMIMDNNTKMIQETLEMFMEQVYQRIPSIIQKCMKQYEQIPQQGRILAKKFKAVNSPEKDDNDVGVSFQGARTCPLESQDQLNWSKGDNNENSDGSRSNE
jgi:hypothetical protein